MKKTIVVSEILAGLLALTMAIITLYPFALGSIGVYVFVFGPLIIASTMLIVGIFRLATVFSFETLSLPKKINVGTSVLTISTAVLILYLQILGGSSISYMGGSGWLHVLFGLGLLGYAVGLLAMGLLSREYNYGLRAYYSAVGIAIGVLSFIVLLFQMVLTSSIVNGGRFYLTYPYFVRIALILIGINCLVSAGVALLLKKQRVANSPLPE